MAQNDSMFSQHMKSAPCFMGFGVAVACWLTALKLQNQHMGFEERLTTTNILTKLTKPSNKYTAVQQHHQQLLKVLSQTTLESCGTMEPAVKAEMEQLLKSSAPVNSKLEQVIKLLTSKGLAYEVVLKPEDLLCHPANRGGAMVNGFDAWAKGNSVLTTGLKPSLLPPNSFCMEMDPARRDGQLQANQQMCAKAENLLGTVMGTERYLTLGTSHFVMYCRALQQGVPGPEGERVKPPPEMSALLASGWKWVAIAAVVETAFPGFPSWCQATLNSVNSTNKVVGELEAMLQISAYLKEGQAMNTAVDLVKAAAPACGAYLEDIGYFCKLFLGGDKFPLLEQLKNFSSLAIIC